MNTVERLVSSVDNEYCRMFSVFYRTVHVETRNVTFTDYFEEVKDRYRITTNAFNERNTAN